MLNNPYKVLGVPNGASKDVCKKAFRKLSALYHPDNGGDADKFFEIKSAWEKIDSGDLNSVFVSRVKSFVKHKTMFSYQKV